MIETLSSEPVAAAAAGLLPANASCDACLGAGGWYRYDPALESSAGLLYLSCVPCRGSGRAASPLAAVLRLA